jgi:hypothetical protein
VDDENDMRILPPTLFVRLRQEKAADRIGRQLYSTHRDRTDDEAIIYLNMQAERLKAERKSVDGVDNGLSNSHIHYTWIQEMIADFCQNLKTSITAPCPFTPTSTPFSLQILVSSAERTLSLCTSLLLAFWIASSSCIARANCSLFHTTLCRCH